MGKIIRSKKFYLMLLIDAFLITACFYLSYLIRFEFSIPDGQFHTFLWTLPYVLSVKLLVFILFNLYKGMWRYTSLDDLVTVVQAVFMSSAIVMLGVLLLQRFEGYPRSIFILDMFLSLLAIGGIRAAVRIYITGENGAEILHSNNNGREKCLLIIGAGNAGEKVVREIRENPSLKIEAVGLLDDDPGKQGKTIHGVPVIGTIDEIKNIDKTFDEIIIAMPSSRGEGMRRVVDACKKTGKQYRTVPGMGELLNGKVSVKTVRQVNLSDLIGREEVRLDQREIEEYIKQKRVLVTGAGGSIGSELVRQICRYNPQSLALIDISELNLSKVSMECMQRFPYVSVSPCLLDIRHRDNVEVFFKEFNPDVVFHAAAYKHVPIQELHPWEAVYNNVLGTLNVAESSFKYNVDRFVLVSTDKAVRPSNVMGATKRVAEMIVQGMVHASEDPELAAQKDANGNSIQPENDAGEGCRRTRFMAVRFGNVIGSSGSAIPIFQEQIARGGPVTVTHPEVTRYFMSIPEAAQLILQAGAMGKGGELFILDMGKQIRILDMARDLIRLQGFEPERDIPIQFIGLRPGEKLYEELITEGEGIVGTEHDKILVLRGNNYDLRAICTGVNELLEIARTYDPHAIKLKLKDVVPEYVPQF